MVREAQHLVRSGRLGKIRVVQVEYALGSRSSLVEAQGDARFAWRADPAIGGPSTVLGDIGTHAHHLMRAVTGLELEAVSADLGTMVPGRKADDNANVNLRFVGGARGQLWASMVACGIGQGLHIRVFGEQASLEWHQEHPNELHLRFENQPNQVLRRGDPWLCEQAKRGVRTNRGQPEGYVSAFANIYRDFAEVLAARKAGRTPDPLANSFASARDGVLGMIFIEAAVESSRRNGAWVEAGAQRLGAASVIGIALFGAGVIGRVHARNVAAHPRLRASLRRRSGSRPGSKRCAARTAGERVVGYRAALADKAVDAVIVASSTSVHNAHLWP